MSENETQEKHRKQRRGSVVSDKGNKTIVGVMVESHLVAGRQDLGSGRNLTYGQSITDACIGWDDTVPMLEQLADAVRQRRAS